MKKVNKEMMKAKTLELKNRALDFYAEHYDAINLVAGVVVFGATCYGAGRSSERLRLAGDLAPHARFQKSYEEEMRKQGKNPDDLYEKSCFDAAVYSLGIIVREKTNMVRFRLKDPNDINSGVLVETWDDDEN